MKSRIYFLIIYDTLSRQKIVYSSTVLLQKFAQACVSVIVDRCRKYEARLISNKLAFIPRFMETRQLV
jgi:hypothetical protein